jgi:hypothetical protein
MGFFDSSVNENLGAPSFVRSLHKGWETINIFLSCEPLNRNRFKGSMESSRILFIALTFVAISAAGVLVEAQTERNASTPQPIQVRQAPPRPVLFELDGESATLATALDFRSQQQMIPEDRALAASAESLIEERALAAGFEFNQGAWRSQQVVCSALPHHLFLRFTHEHGAGDVSVFTASVPRGSVGQARIIPILRRGYSLFSPAPMNALTISVFNHIRAEEQPDKAPEWLATGLCYAALAGAHPEIVPPDDSNIQKLPAAPPGLLQFLPRGGAMIRFTDEAAAPRPMAWTMTFDGQGKLLKATHSAVPRTREKVAVRTPAEVQGRPVNREQR